MEITMSNKIQKDYELSNEQINAVMNGERLNIVFEFEFDKDFLMNVKRRIIRAVWNETADKTRNFSRKIGLRFFYGKCCQVKDLVNTKTRRTEYFETGYASYVEEIEAMSKTKLDINLQVTFKIGGKKNGRR